MFFPQTLIPRHGGYRKLKSFQMTQLVYDLSAGWRCGRKRTRGDRLP